MHLKFHGDTQLTIANFPLGRHGKKGRRKEKPGKRGGVGDDDLNIYPDLAEYEPSTATSHLAAEQRAKKRAPYFTKSEHDIDEGPSVPRSIPNPSALANVIGEGSTRYGYNMVSIPSPVRKQRNRERVICDVIYLLS